MNRNYKVIWNVSLNCFMAVSEYAKARGKSSQSSVSSNATINTTSNLSSTNAFRLTAIGLGLMAAGFSMQATASPCNGSAEVECGTNTTVSALHGIAIGKNATVLGSQGIAIGGGSSGQNTTASGEQSIAIGANVVSSGASSIAIGGDDLDAASKTDYDGSISTGALNSGQVNTTFHEYAGRDLLESWDAYGKHTESSGAASIAMGAKARSAGNLATAIGIHSSASGMASSAFGVASAATGQGALAVGVGANSSTQDGVALGSRSVANVASGALGFAPTSASAADQTAIKATNSTNLGAVSIGNAKDGTRQIVNLAAGTNDSDAVNVSQLKSLANVVSKGQTRYYSVNDNGVAKANYNNDGAIGGNSMAAGIAATADGTFATAIGTEANAQGYASTALGNEADATKTNSLALGRQSKATGVNSTALGWEASASAENSMAMGREAKAEGANNIALGRAANTFGRNSTALGFQASASANNSMALGTEAKASTAKSIALGEGATATHEGSVALGSGSLADGLTLGVFAYQPLDKNGNPIGVVAPTASSELSVGAVSNERRITNVAAGATDTDAVNVSQLKSVVAYTDDTVEANKTRFYNVNSTDSTRGNYNNDGAIGVDAIAVGVDAQAAGDRAVAMGKRAQAAMDGATALGSNAYAKGIDATAVGNRAQAGRNSIALGMDANALNSGTVALGTQSFAGQGATVVGTNAKANGKDSTALGRFAKANDTDSVALGSFSETATAVGTSNVVLVNRTYNFAGAVPKGTVSVGSVGNERTITNVAAGRISDTSTDAINGSQLYATNSAVNKNSSDIDLGLNFTGDNSVTTVNRKLGDKLTVKGGATTALSDKNIGVVADSTNNSLTVKLAKNIDLGASGSVKMGTRSPWGLGSVTTIDDSGMRTGSLLANTDVNGLGVFVNGPLGIPSTTLTVDGLNIIGGPSVTRSGGIDAGNKRITRVSNGIDPTDAVNLSQLTGAAAGSRTEVKAGTNIVDVGKTVGDKGQDVYTVNAKGTTATAGSSAVTVNGNEVDSNITDYTVDLSQDSKDSLAKADSALQTVVTQIDGQTVKTIKQDNNTANFMKGSNIVLTAEDGGIKVALAKDLTDLSSANIGGVTISSTGINANNTQIKGVKAGSAGTDAVNVDQLGTAISSNKTKYYSVNSTDGTNDLNEGATGQNAMAMGRNAVASGSQAISIGSSAGGQKTTASGHQSIAIGANSVSTGASSIAIGGDDLDVASKTNIDGSLASAINKGDVNDKFKAYTGHDLVESPPYKINTESGGAASIAMGAKALSSGALSTAIGVQSASAGVASSAFGVGSSASLEGSVALGAGSTTASNATKELTMSVGGSRYNVAGAAQAAGDQVSVGSKGMERQIKNVASGAVNASSTDAINGSQLHATNDRVNINTGNIQTNKETIAKGVAFKLNGTTKSYALGEPIQVDTDANITVVGAGNGAKFGINKNLTGLNSATFGGVVISQSGLNNGSKQITNVASGVGNDSNAANIGDVQTIAGGLKTIVAKGTNIKDVTKSTVNGQDTYTVNADGASVSGGSAAVSVSAGAKGANNVTDYKVDLSQGAKDSLVKADSALQNVVTQIDGQTVKTIDQDNNTANFMKGDNILLTEENGGIKVATAQDMVLNSVKMGNTTISKDGMTIVAPTLARTVVLNSTGLNNGGNKITNVKAGEMGTDAVNVDQLNLANTIIDKGLSFGGDSGEDVNRKLGDTLTVKGGDTVDSDPATKNISVTANGKDTLTVRLAKDINLGNTGSVTTGNTQVNNAGITLYNGDNDQVVLSNNGLNNGNNKIINVVDGMLSPNSKDAVNGSQLFKTNENIAKGIKFDLNGNTKTYALGEAIQVATDANITTTAFGNGAKFGLADTIKIGGTSPNAVSIDGMAGTVKGLSNTTFDANATYSGGQAATQEQLSGLQSGINSTFDKGISFGGDSGTDVKRKLGDKITVKGGVSDSAKLTDSNIGVIADKDTNTLTVKLAKDLTGLNSASFGSNVNVSSTGFRAGDTLVNQNGFTFVGEGGQTRTVMLSNSGLNNGGNKITNVARGEATTDAVNVEQLNEVKQSAADANKGWNVSAQGANTSTVKPGNTVDLNNTDNNITVSKTAESNNVSFNLSKDIAVDSVTTGDATLSSSGLNIAGGPSVTKNGIDAGGNKITNVAKGDIEIDSKDAINGSQLFEFVSLVNTQTTAIAEMGAGLNFDADSGPVINKKAGSDPLKFKGGNNITTTSEDGSIKFDLNGNINVDSVTTGNTTVNNSGVTIKNGPSMTAAGIYAGNAENAPSMTAAGINAAGTKVTNVADGMAPRDAVNYGQLEAVTRGLGGSINELGYRIGEVEDDANAGISAAMAMSSLPQAYIIGKPMIGGGIATYNGESAVAIGFSKMSNDGRWVMKLNGTADTQGNVGGAIGAGFHFD
ncbi:MULTISPECIES: YadA-like family protein [unclassified Psychrobacter]|uniref:YadA-like family protein n=1 Tax=unclassified Psychrobacter TaxID=196806 RepID=UPI0025DCB9FA|nr:MULTISPECIES: YadA-like family protein [unclassified Psychrobacter]